MNHLYIYVDGIEKIHQEGTFTNPTVDLSTGTHQITCVASVNPVTSGVQEKVKDTFGYSYSLPVGQGTKQQQITLSRIITKLNLVMEDAIPEGITKVTVTSNFSNSFNPLNMECIKASSNSKDIEIPNSAYGIPGVSLNYSAISQSESWTQNIQLDFYKGTEKYISNSLKDVPFENNRITTITGKFFNKAPELSFSVNTAWKDEFSFLVDQYL